MPLGASEQTNKSVAEISAPSVHPSIKRYTDEHAV
jgi:hypothetical protein